MAKNKSNHQIVDTENNIIIQLEIAENYNFSGSQSIIVNESATGESAIVYSNGRTQEDVPITGTLLGESIDDVTNKKNVLIKLHDLGSVVEFISPYNGGIRSNKYFIKSHNFDVNAGNDKTLSFSLILTEKRDANVKKVSVNLVGFESAELMKQIYNERTGNL